MCRNIKTLRAPYAVGVTDDDVHAAALQYVRTVGGMRLPSPNHAEAFNQAVDAISVATRALLAGLEASQEHVEAHPENPAASPERPDARQERPDARQEQLDSKQEQLDSKQEHPDPKQEHPDAKQEHLDAGPEQPGGLVPTAVPSSRRARSAWSRGASGRPRRGR